MKRKRKENTVKRNKIEGNDKEKSTERNENDEKNLPENTKKLKICKK